MTDITDTLEENSASDIVADAKAWLADIGGGQRLQTHSGNCHKWHSTCLVSKLTREIERLRTLATHATLTEGSVQGEGTDTVGQRLVERLSITQAMLDDNERLRAEIDRLREAIRRLAEQDATLSVQGGNVIVTMDATLTDAEREAVEIAINWLEPDSQVADELRGLLERLRTQKHKASRRAQRHVPETYFKSNEKRVDCDTNRDTAEPRNGALCEPVAWAAWFDDARGPIGWAVVLPDGGAYERCDFRWEAQAIADALPANEGVTATVVPLYPQPSLTDAEREAVLWYAEYGSGDHAATLRGLLERLHT